MDKKNTSLEKNHIDVIIDDKKYTLITTESEEYIQGVSKYIDNKINEISTSTKSLSKSQNEFYIWLCLNIADDLFKQRQLYLKNKNVFDIDIEKINSDNNNLREKLEVSESQVSSLKEKLEVSENQVSSLKEKLEVSESQVSSLKEKLEVSESQVSSLKEKLDALESQVSSLKEKLDASESQVSSLSEEIKGFENQKNTEDSISNNTDELEKLNNKIDILKQENDILKSSFDKFSEQLNIKLDSLESTDEINDIINIHNRMIIQVARKLEKLKISGE